MSELPAAQPERILPIIPMVLQRPEKPWLAVLVGWMLTFSGSLLLAFIARQIFPDAPPPDFGNLKGGMAVFMLIVFAPILETLIMAFMLWVLLFFIPARWAILVAALSWGVFHSLEAPTWGISIWWPFLIFSLQFVVWRQRGTGWGLAIPAMTHACQNLLPAIAFAYGVGPLA